MEEAINHVLSKKEVTRKKAETILRRALENLENTQRSIGREDSIHKATHFGEYAYNAVKESNDTLLSEETRSLLTYSQKELADERKKVLWQIDFLRKQNVEYEKQKARKRAKVRQTKKRTNQQVSHNMKPKILVQVCLADWRLW